MGIVERKKPFLSCLVVSSSSSLLAHHVAVGRGVTVRVGGHARVVAVGVGRHRMVHGGDNLGGRGSHHGGRVMVDDWMVLLDLS